MSNYEVQPVPEACRNCGTIVQPRLSREYDRFQKATIVEGRWVCGTCGGFCRRGIVEIIPDAKK